MEINKDCFLRELNRVFKLNGLDCLLDGDKAEKLYRLTVIMLTENEKYNLTAIKDPDKIILGHYADCAVLATKLGRELRVVDVGCGAGFPTLPLAILRDDLTVVGIDSTAKRVAYVNATARELGLSNVTAIASRAEESARKPELRESFDVATARAVAEMRILCELCLPYVKVGGSFVAMKGRNAEAELQAAKRAITALGGREEAYQTVTLVGNEELSHPLIWVRKKNHTPTEFPRPYAKILKKPL